MACAPRSSSDTTEGPLGKPMHTSILEEEKLKCMSKVLRRRGREVNFVGGVVEFINNMQLGFNAW